MIPMENLPTVYTALRLPADVYADLVKLAGGKRKGKDGKLSSIIRDYIAQGLEHDRTRNASGEGSK
jgi:hypothetical protein